MQARNSRAPTLACAFGASITFTREHVTSPPLTMNSPILAGLSAAALRSCPSHCCIGGGFDCTRRTVGTGLFWQKALAEEKARWQWRRRRTDTSVTIQVTIVVLLTLAAAGPQIPASKRIVLIIDNSATMRATDVPPYVPGRRPKRPPGE